VTPRLELDEAVRDALAGDRSVVALETSVLAQGLPDPHRREAATRMQAAVRDAGAEPAWIWVEAGAIRVGGDESDLGRLMTGDAMKVARRDLPMAVSFGRTGATTVSAMLWAAGEAGIEVAATGGIGGVHPGSRDVSADLVTLATAGGMLVCSGPKSIIDPVATLERLEELGVGLVAYRTDRLPHFLVRQTSLPLEHRAESPGDLAALLEAGRAIGMPSTLVACNPIPDEAAMEPSVVEEAVAECRARAEEATVSGKELTPFLLGCLAERTGGASLRANLALLEANARLAGEVATELRGLRSHGTVI
jgi:pseudouridine-5'-phosphate glycosidase